MRISMKYNLSALEIMKFLGYDALVGKEKLEEFEKVHQVALPQTYRDFMEVAHQCPMLETADLWNNVDQIYWFYEELAEWIADECDAWNDDTESYQEDELYQLAQMPCDKWNERVSNFLEIGSDFGGGIVTFGISLDTMNQKDPPLYFHHEADSHLLWRQDENGERLSDFLLDVVLNALALTDYETAEEALEDMGWKYTDLSFEQDFQDCIQALKIDLSKIEKYGRGNCNNRKLFCCCDDAKRALYVGCIADPDMGEESTLYQIT